MDLIEIERIKMLISTLNSAVMFCSEDEKAVINQILSRNKSVLTSKNKEEKIVLNPTKRELGSMKQSIKQVCIQSLVRKIHSLLYSQLVFECDNPKWDHIRDIDGYIIEDKNNPEYIKFLEAEILQYEHLEKLNIENNRVSNLLNRLVEETKFSDELIQKKLYLTRYYGYRTRLYANDSTRLSIEVNKHVNTLILSEFESQNREELNKLKTKYKL